MHDARFRSLSWWGPSVGLAWALLAPSTASAAGEACLRDTACAGAELCLDGACAEAGPAPAACESDGDCEGTLGCNGGFCKGEGVACRNLAGACWVENGGGSCMCNDGEGSGWSDGFNPDDPPPVLTDEELVEVCTSALVDSCGVDPPALPPSCAGDVLTDCEAFVDVEDAILRLCGDEVPTVNIARVGACCDTFDDEVYAAYRTCVTAIEVGDTCPGDAFATCEAQGGDPNGADAEGDGSPEEGDDGTKSACTIGGHASPWWFAALFGLAWALRRRPIPAASGSCPRS
jgi:hypothetical protein